MNCRKNCGACCIAPSISSPIPGMPEGKPAGIRCIHLQEDFSCGIYDTSPKVCRDFQAEEIVCGSSSQEALSILTRLENEVESGGSLTGTWEKSRNMIELLIPNSFQILLFPLFH